MLRKFIGTTLWLLATGVTAAIMLSAMGTQSYILSVIGLIGILAASTGVFLAMDAARDRAVIAFVLSLMLWVIGESFLLPSEFNFWSATVTARAEREADIQRQADGRRLILDRTAGRLAREKPARSAAEVQSAINEQLAKTFGKKATLNSLTKGCTDLDSPSIRFCRDVLSLRKELKTAEDYEKDSGLVWEANTRIDTNTSDAHGAHDGFMNAAKLFGGTPDQWALVLTAVTMLLLLFTRGLSLYLGFRTAKRLHPRKPFDWNAFRKQAEATVEKPEATTVASPAPPTVAKAELPDAKPTPPARLPEPKKEVALQASAGTEKKVLPFRLAGASPRLASLDDVVAFVMSSKPTGRHYFCDLMKEVEHVAEANFLPKPHEPIVGGLIAAHCGSKGRRDGSRGNATFYTVKRPRKQRSNQRAPGLKYPHAAGGLLEIA